MKLQNSYFKLPKNFYKEQTPDKIKHPELILFNKKLARELNLELDKDPKNLAQIFSGNKLLKNSKPISLAYAGHQFGNFVPQLGDGRAILLGEIINNKKQIFDIQLKGSGKTFFSRNGDGKCTINAAIREYLMSEAMHYLKVPTTRALALTKSNEFVQREISLLGAKFIRIAKSHIRIGTFEYFAAQGDLKNVKILANYSIQRHYSKLKNHKNPYLSFLKEIIKSQAQLVSSWMSIGFIHGVMNTDNTSISGQTIDYGPCAFLDEYEKDKVFSYIDRYGRYGFSNQKNIILWNLSMLASCILPLINLNTKKATEIANKELSKFEKIFDGFYYQKMAKKIGLFNFNNSDQELIDQFLTILEKNKIDFTNGFRILSAVLDGKDFYVKNNEYQNWQEKWQKRVNQQNLTKTQIITKMNKINPAIIPRNHIVERIINKAAQNNDFSEMKSFLKILEKPFIQTKENEIYSKPPQENERVINTFCGT